MVNPETREVRGLVRATNVGRRPIFISIAGIEAPPPFDGLILVLNDSISGTKLNEGDKPVGYFITHKGMSKYSGVWRQMRAFVEDSTGKRYVSKYPGHNAKPPRWVEEQL